MASESLLEGKNEVGFTVTQDEFLHSAENFIQKSDVLYDGWSMAECNGVKFMKLVTQRMIETNEEDTQPTLRENEQVDQHFNASAECLNESCRKSKNPQSVMFLEYHVIYSVSYSVPVLYLRGFDAVGGVLRIDKLIKNGEFFNDQQGIPKNKVVDLKSVSEINDISDMPECLSIDNNFVRPDTFSQAPHPLFFEPFYQLHPCHTSHWMKMMYSAKEAKINSTTKMQLSMKNYITIWLSFVGPFVGLSLDNKYMLI